MSAYATASDLQAYVSEDVTLPSESEQTRLLARASEIIDESTLGNVDTGDDDHVEAAKNAACAQVEMWLAGMAGEDADVNAQGIARYSIGDLSVDFGRAGGTASGPVNASTLAPRARRYLFNAGLLYRGVGIR